MYASEPNSAPWYSAAMVYATYYDMAFDTFGGNISDISAYAMEIVERISPYGGSAESIQTFYNDMTSLQDRLYGTGENSISSILSDLPKDARELTYELHPQEGTLWQEAVTTTVACTFPGFAIKTGEDYQAECASGQKCWDDGSCVPLNYCEQRDGWIAGCKGGHGDQNYGVEGDCIYNECSGYMATTSDFSAATVAAQQGPPTDDNGESPEGYVADTMQAPFSIKAATATADTPTTMQAPFSTKATTTKK